MKKKQAFEIVEFVENHYDCVNQDDWFDFCEMVMDVIVDEANRRGYAKELAAKFPYMFKPVG